MNKRIYIILFFILSVTNIKAESFLINFLSFQDSLYNNNKFELIDGKYSLIFETYQQFYKERLYNEYTDKLNDKIEESIEFIDDSENLFTPYEKQIVTAVFYGILAYINIDKSSYNAISNGSESLDFFEEAEKFKTKDSFFGKYVYNLLFPIYFEDSFFVSSILRYEGDIKYGLKGLNKLSKNGELTKIESNLLLINFYSDILHDYKKSLKYSEYLANNYRSSYFKFLYAKDLLNIGSYEESLKTLKNINDNIEDNFYPYNLYAYLLEAECYYKLEDFNACIKLLDFIKPFLENDKTKLLKVKSYIGLGNEKDAERLLADIEYFSEISFDEIKKYIELEMRVYNFKNNLSEFNKLSSEKLKREIIIQYIDITSNYEIDKAIINLLKVSNFTKKTHLYIDIALFKFYLRNDRVIKSLQNIEEIYDFYGGMTDDYPDSKRLILLYNIVKNFHNHM